MHPGHALARHGTASQWYADHGMLDNAVQHALAGRQAGRAVCGANGLHQDCRSSDHASLVADVTVDEVLAEALDLLATETARASAG